ncbi:MAG TPA: hypothetical protein VGI39_22405 [Polyangiaceae bacterium]|jgi:hypothetical protein
MRPREMSPTEPTDPLKAPLDTGRITFVPPGGSDTVRGEMATLVDDGEMEEARLESMRRSSVSLETAAKVPPAPASEADIDVVWAPESKTLDTHELFTKYAAILGDFNRVPIVTVPFDQLPSLSMDSRMGFLVALIDGTSSIQTLLDVAGMPAREMLHALVTLRDVGIVGFGDEAGGRS